jgi:hypothetical protein
MEKVKATIYWCEKNYCATSVGDLINGVVISTNKTLAGVKRSFSEALQFHLEGCIKDDDRLSDDIRTGNYEIEFTMDTSALLHSLEGILTRSAIARVTGINERQLGHYASGIRTPRPQQRERIINGIRAISRELIAVV